MKGLFTFRRTRRGRQFIKSKKVMAIKKQKSILTRAREIRSGIISKTTSGKKFISEAKFGIEMPENHEPVSQISTANVPPDNELFTGEVPKELTAVEVFAGDKDFFTSLGDSTSSKEANIPLKIQALPSQYKRFSSIQKVIAAAIVLIAAMLVYVFSKSPSVSIANLSSEPTSQIAPAAPLTQAPKLPVAEAAPLTSQQIQEPEPKLDSTQPLSLKVAQTFYLNGDYDQALRVYEKLHTSLPESSKEDLMRDFLQLQMALCMERTADYEQASRLFRTVSLSRSPVVRMAANYHLSLLEMQKKQYLNARTEAYRAIALIDAVDFDKNWKLSLKQDCYFLAAEAVTRKVLSLCDADKDLPEDLWGNFGASDEPFTKLNETELRTLLNSGSQRLGQAILGPQIQRFDHQGGLTRYDVTCNNAPVEELLARFASNSALDLHWDLSTDETGILKRQVYLYLPSATTQQFVTAAAGCAGLLTRIDEEKGMVNIFNPDRYSYVSEHKSFLSEESFSLWQKFLLGFPEDPRLSTVHFVLGLLHAQKGQPIESIAEYKLVANRFSGSSLAPFALLNSSKVKNSLHDYAGAREDLNLLVEQFPDTEIAGKAYLHLAEATAKAALTSEAARLYCKVYNLSLSSESQSAAALGAGKCFYRIKDYKSAVKWLSQYIGLANDQKNKDLYSAYFLLGKTNLALGNSNAACDALQYAMEGWPSQLTKEEYIETIPVIVEAYMQQGHFVPALDLLEDIHSVTLSQEESTEILLLKSRVLRAMGLVDNAIVILGDRAEYIPDPQLKAEICFELSECYIEKGDLNLAHGKLAEILVLAESGPLSHKSALRLGDVCLRLGQNSQTISVCSQLLDLQPSEQIKQEALKLLSMAYSQQKDHDRAALALLGQWK